MFLYVLTQVQHQKKVLANTGFDGWPMVLKAGFCTMPVKLWALKLLTSLFTTSPKMRSANDDTYL